MLSGEGDTSHMIHGHSHGLLDSSYESFHSLNQCLHCDNALNYQRQIDRTPRFVEVSLSRSLFESLNQGSGAQALWLLTNTRGRIYAMSASNASAVPQARRQIIPGRRTTTRRNLIGDMQPLPDSSFNSGSQNKQNGQCLFPKLLKWDLTC